MLKNLKMAAVSSWVPASGKVCNVRRQYVKHSSCVDFSELKPCGENGKRYCFTPQMSKNLIAGKPLCTYLKEVWLHCSNLSSFCCPLSIFLFVRPQTYFLLELKPSQGLSTVISQTIPISFRFWNKKENSFNIYVFKRMMMTLKFSVKELPWDCYNCKGKE